MIGKIDHQQDHINIMNILLPNSCGTLLRMITYPFPPKSTFEDADFPNVPFGGDSTTPEVPCKGTVLKGILHHPTTKF